MRERYIRAACLQGLEPLLLEYGVPLQPLLQSVGLQPHQLDDPERFIRYEAFLSLLEQSADACHDPILGLRLSQQQNLQTLGRVADYLLSQKSIRDALQMAQKYLYLHVEGLSLNLQQGRGELCELRFINLSQSGGDYPQKALFTLGSLYRAFQALAGPDLRIHRIQLRQPAPNKGQAFFQQHFPGEATFNAEYDALCFPAKLLDRPPQQAAATDRYTGAALPPPRPGEPLDQIEGAIRVLLTTGDCTKENVADMLALHPKKLQRLLQKEQTSFRQLLEEIRRKEALRQLKQPDISLTSLALQLGYSELAVFSRRFKDWFGLSPSEWQKIHLS